MNTRTTILDAHVHIHDCFELAEFFACAQKNFRAGAAAHGANENFDGVLMLSESFGVNKFDELRRLLAAKGAPERDGWSATPTLEKISLTVESGARQRLIVIAGRQIVTAENLEVLALGMVDGGVKDGLPIKTVVETVRESGALCVLPWGFGKWIGKRGRIVREFIDSGLVGSLFLGDNSGRLALWPEPAEFRAAFDRGIRILPGTDPLPFPSEVTSVGRFGWYMDRGIDHQRPFADIKRALLEEERVPKPYGPCEKLWRFVKHQMAMQMRKFARSG